MTTKKMQIIIVIDFSQFDDLMRSPEAKLCAILTSLRSKILVNNVSFHTRNCVME